MSFFNRLIGKRETQPYIPPPSRERLWVGEIVGLLMAHIQDYGISEIEQWTIVINDDGDFQYISLIGGLPGVQERAMRHCVIGSCPGLVRIIDYYRTAPSILEMAVQDLAFEICRLAEPRWDEIIKHSQST